jgi:plasmid stabilization system protein ParE
LAKVIWDVDALLDLDRIADFLLQAKVDPKEPVGDIVEAIEMLARHPLLGRAVEAGLRELIISRGATGYIALYEFVEGDDQVFVFAIRHQREAGWRG